MSSAASLFYRRQVQTHEKRHPLLRASFLYITNYFRACLSIQMFLLKLAM